MEFYVKDGGCYWRIRADTKEDLIDALREDLENTEILDEKEFEKRFGNND